MDGAPTILYCVGAAKAGTSWLYGYCLSHRDVYVRSVKELHYFDAYDLGRRDGQRRRCAAQVADLTAKLARAGDEAARAALTAELGDAQALAGLHRREGGPHLAAYYRYLCAGRGQEAVVADITPAYSLLSVETLGQMARAAAETRFIYILRDPVDRLWSHIRMKASRRAKSADEIERRANRIFTRFGLGRQQSLWARSDYRGTLERLNAALSPGRLLVLFYEELFSPAAVETICDFLGISRQPAAIAEPVHKGPELRLDDERRALARGWLDAQYAYVQQQTEYLPPRWLAYKARIPA